MALVSQPRTGRLGDGFQRPARRRGRTRYLIAGLVVVVVLAAAGAILALVSGGAGPTADSTALTKVSLPFGGVAIDEFGDPLPAATLATCLALTFLNPHVYLDTVVLIGGLSARHAPPAAIAFGIGAAVASVVWFFGLAYGARLLAPLFARPPAWRVLDAIIALVMWGIAARLIGEALV